MAKQQPERFPEGLNMASLFHPSQQCHVFNSQVCHSDDQDVDMPTVDQKPLLSLCCTYFSVIALSLVR